MSSERHSHRMPVKALMVIYDDNQDGQLDEEEKARLEKDLHRRAIRGFGARFAWGLLKGDGKSGPGYLARQRELLEFDSDGDGHASLEELERIRAARDSASQIEIDSK